MERAFEEFGNQSEIEKYRVELDSISKSMRKLAVETATLRKELTVAGKDELASIVFDLQKQEEELLLIRFDFVQVALNLFEKKNRFETFLNSFR